MSRDAGSKGRVLVVDDSRLMRELAKDALSDLAQVECVDSGEAALAFLAREHADLVLTDLEMQGISGLELIERVRPSHPETAFILLTAHASVDSAVRALRDGAADYLRKPIRGEELALTVERVLAHQRLLRDNERLRDALRTIEACRTLLHCVDPGEVYSSSLDLLLHGTGHRRGLVLFDRVTPPGSVGVVLRGFFEEHADGLRRLLVEEKRDREAALPERPEVVRCAPFESALIDVGVEGGPALAVPLGGAGTEGGPALAVPVGGAGTEGGVAWVFAEERPFDEMDLERATLIAGHAALALGNAERYHQAKERAFVDDVTEVYNARYLLQAAQNEIQRAERYNKQLTVLFLDLDRFKRVNDQHGHLVGSRVLRRLSEVLGECVRQVDTLARYGGDEFTVLCVDTDLETGLQVAERIRRTVAGTLFEGEGGAPIRLTISIGVAAYPQHSRDRTGLLDLADKAMYRAKSRGRDCVCSASDLS
jgi:diguanylate cyclase (GGDEF)-like protein